jgi:hypothetical protein
VNVFRGYCRLQKYGEDTRGRNGTCPGERIYKISHRVAGRYSGRHTILFFDGTSENVGYVLGVSGGEIITESYEAPVRFEENGNHVVHAVWHKEGADIEKYNSIDEIKNDPNGRVVEWNVYVLDKDSTLDDIRQVIDDLIRIGTVAWAGKELRNMLKDRMSDRGDDADSTEEDSSDDFQEVLTNFE